MSIQENLSIIQNHIKIAAEKAGRAEDDIILLGATKTVSPSRIKEAVNAGLLHIGENRVQEFVEKYDHAQNATWHFIGHLQTNKVKYIVGKAALIHAVDSIKLLHVIEKQAEKLGVCADVLIEVNASGEESKFGVSFDAVRPMLEENEKNKHVHIRGLMTIGPHTKESNTVRNAFCNMRNLYENLAAEKFEHASMEYLSMGMSGDYMVAIEEGANIVRLGSAIFGNREWRE